ncbi:hypothetical protein TNCT_455421 [Trichonephila clavata]|uniref:Uncharacterized protein n=1 Tax=Trichonephila clavata TaxID=2740835 RepID=A0A8X6H746_TRICU|nr:hypothetical protein TNCT_455421 [Trichonephila clavata]
MFLMPIKRVFEITCEEHLRNTQKARNCRKEDLRIVALGLFETLSYKVTIIELTEIIKENKYFMEDVEFVEELIQYTIEDLKQAKEDRKKADETML